MVSGLDKRTLVRGTHTANDAGVRNAIANLVKSWRDNAETHNAWASE